MLEAASALLAARHYPEVVSTCRTELELDPDNVDLRLILAEALMALRRDAEAQLEVAAVLQIEPHAPGAYRMLGELAWRRSELRAAGIFLREALRLDPDDEHAQVLLRLVQHRKQPAAAAAKLPAASAAAGPFTSPPSLPLRRRVARGTDPGEPLALETRPAPFAALADERPLRAALADETTRGEGDDDGPDSVGGARRPAWTLPKTDPGEPTVRASHIESAVLRLNSGQSGFGEHLVESGVLTRWQLYCVLHLQDWKRIRLGEAVVRLGFADARTIERAARSYHAALRGAPEGVAAA